MNSIPPMSAEDLKNRLRAGCVQVFVPVGVQVGTAKMVWMQIKQSEAKYLRTSLRGQIDVADPDPEIDDALASRCGGGRILRLVPRRRA